MMYTALRFMAFSSEGDARQKLRGPKACVTKQVTARKHYEGTYLGTALQGALPVNCSRSRIIIA